MALPVRRLTTETFSSPLSRFQSSSDGSMRGLRRRLASSRSASGLVGRSGVMPCWSASHLETCPTNHGVSFLKQPKTKTKKRKAALTLSSCGGVWL